MNTVRDEYTTIVGVDTHARTNTYALLEATSGRIVDTATFPTSPPGLARAITWIDRGSAPGKTLVAIEGTNSYGATLTRALAATELEVCEVRPPRRGSRAGRGSRMTSMPWQLPARCSPKRSRPCFNPAREATARPCEF